VELSFSALQNCWWLTAYAQTLTRAPHQKRRFRLAYYYQFGYFSVLVASCEACSFKVVAFKLHLVNAGDPHRIHIRSLIALTQGAIASDDTRLLVVSKPPVAPSL
jgi:hypothetical protein